MEEQTGITLKDAAASLGITYEAVRGLIRRGRLQLVGGDRKRDRRITEQSLEDWRIERRNKRERQIERDRKAAARLEGKQ